VLRVYDQRIRCQKLPADAQGSLSVVLRPEALGLTIEPNSGVAARVVGLSYIGPIVRYELKVAQDDSDLTVDVHNPSPEQFYEEGAQVSVLLPEEVPSALSPGRSTDRHPETA
jgi:ABC-type Fe3+/spermidine/putrescine transport system ATPase subunit